MKKKSPDADRQDALQKRIDNLIRTHRLLTKNDTVIVAVSGGPDSVALLHLLCRITIHVKPVAVYVNHLLRPDETGSEILLIEELCNHLHVPFETAIVDVHGERQLTGASLEEAARTLRYHALEDARRRWGASVIAVAHTADDQAEEVLIRLVRGSGRKGLSGMDLRRDSIIRPLLQEKKQTLIRYLEENNTPFCQDSSNLKRIFLRNRVRLDLLPYLERNYNKSIRQTLLQTADILSVEEDLLTRLTEESYQHLVEIHGTQGSGTESCPEQLTIKTRPFLDCHQALQRRILEKAFWMMLTRPGFRQIEQIRCLFRDGGNGAEVHLGRGLRAWKTGERVLFSHPASRRSFRGSGLGENNVALTVKGPGTYQIADHTLCVSLKTERPGRLNDSELLLDAERIAFPLILRNPLPGERFRPLGAAGRKKINRFLTDAKIPRQDRRYFPILVSEGRIVAIAGLRIDHDYRVQEDTRCFLLIDWQKSS